MENRKVVSFKMEEEKWYKLKIISLNKKMKLNDMLEEIVNNFIINERENNA